MAVIIFKAIESCNSNCVYCDVIQKHQKNTMNYETLEIVFNRMNDYLLKFPNEIINFTWHGGEPCLLGADFFNKAYELQEKHCKKTKKRIKHLIQTNLTLLSQPIVDALKKLKISSLGSSFDPTPHIRGFGKTRDEKEYMKAFFNGYNIAKSNGIKVGFIYVVHKHSLKEPMATFNYLANVIPDNSPQFNRLYMYHDDKYGLGITMEEYAHFLGAIFKEWWNNKHKYPDFQPISSMIKTIDSMQNNMSCFFAGHCSHNWVGIYPDGSLTHCGRIGDFDLLIHGNIKSLSIEESLNHDYRKKINERILNLKDSECKECRLWGICHGGCALDAYMSNNDFVGKAEDCIWMKIFFSEYFEPITGKKIKLYPTNKEFKERPN